MDDTSSDGHATDRRRANGSFSQAFTSTPASIARVRTALAGYATQVGAGLPVVEAVRLAVSEAATNVVAHAYPRGPGLIQVEASIDGDALNVGIADSGTGLRPRRDSPGLGLGLAIIGELADNVELLQGEDGGLRVLMRFALAARPDAT